MLVVWLSAEPWLPGYGMVVLMFQREVAERIVARENDEAYGRLGVLANWRAETKILFDISPGAFVPLPCDGEGCDHAACGAAAATDGDAATDGGSIERWWSRGAAL